MTAVTTLSLVIPAFDEEARLPGLLDSLAADAPRQVEAAGYELLEAVIVDDGSNDRTAEVLRAGAEADPRVRSLLGWSENRGKGAAVAAGVAAARGEFVLQVDVDLSTPLDELGRLGAALRGGADLAIGSRVLEGSAVQGPLHRIVLGRGFNGLVRVLTGMPYRDTQCPFKLMRTSAWRDCLAAQSCPGFAYDVELLLRARLAGLSVVEVPVSYLHDDRSRVRVASASPRMLIDVVRLAYRVRARRGSRAEATRVGAV